MYVESVFYVTCNVYSNIAVNADLDVSVYANVHAVKI